jgi:hypothetical protein
MMFLLLPGRDGEMLMMRNLDSVSLDKLMIELTTSAVGQAQHPQDISGLFRERNRLRGRGREEFHSATINLIPHPTSARLRHLPSYFVTIVKIPERIVHDEVDKVGE